MPHLRAKNKAGLVLLTLTSSALAQGISLPGLGDLPSLPSGFDDLTGSLSGYLPSGVNNVLEQGESAVNWLGQLSQPGGWQSQFLGGLSPDEVLQKGLRRVGDRVAKELNLQQLTPSSLGGTFEQAKNALENKAQSLLALDWLESDLNTPLALNPSLLDQKREAKAQQAEVQRAKKDDLSSLERGVKAVGSAEHGTKEIKQSTERVLGKKDAATGVTLSRGVADRLTDAGKNATSTREAVGVLNTTLLETLKQKAVSDEVIVAQLEQVAQLQNLSNEQMGELVARIREQKLREAEEKYQRIENLQREARSRAAELQIGSGVSGERMKSLVSVPPEDWKALEDAARDLK